MKLKEFKKLVMKDASVTITEFAHDKKTGKYYSFRTVYYKEPMSKVDDEYILDLDVIGVSSDVFNLMIDVKSYIEIPEEE